MFRELQILVLAANLSQSKMSSHCLWSEPGLDHRSQIPRVGANPWLGAQRIEQRVGALQRISFNITTSVLERKYGKSLETLVIKTCLSN